MANGSKSLVGKSCYFGKDMHGLYSFGAFMSVVRLLNIKDGAKYIFYLMNSDIYWKNIALLLSGSSINNLRPGDILGMVFKFPDKDERDAIMKVLDDMENEIIDLDNKLAKYRQIKHGMMQKLLTGEIRLM
jgi:type I restriction enzyme S subunit